MPHPRIGSALLLCISLAALAIIVGFSFLRTASRQIMTGRNDLLVAHARSAAQSGLTHAIEQIMQDYNQPSLVVATGSGNVTIADPPTFLDGQWRAPFVSLRSPNVLMYTQDETASLTADLGQMQMADDVQEENFLVNAYAKVPDMSYMRWHDYYPVASYGTQSGMSIYDGRGTWIEANHYNSSRPDPGAVQPTPVATIRFTDPNAATPEHDNGLFLDDSFRRLTAGSTAQQRRDARYRLRYAVGVEDLHGHLLVNPIADMNVDWTDPNNTYRKPPAWLEHGSYVLYNTIAGWVYAGTSSLRIGHIFMGRGHATNADRHSTPGPRHGLPATFPKMFRNTRTSIPSWWNSASSFWGWFAEPPPVVGGTIYGYAGNATWPAITADPAGNQVLTPVGQHWAHPYSHALMGPQHSWWNFIFAMTGTRYPNQPNYDSDSDGRTRGGSGLTGEQPFDQPRINFAMLFSLYGRRLESTPAPKPDWTWYQGKLDTPWHINLLTAAPQTISQMITAYLPPYLKTLHWTQQEVYQRTGIDANDQDIFSPSTITQTSDGAYKTGPISRTSNLPGIDVLTAQVTSGMSEFPPPSTSAPDVSPNYWQPTDPRPVENRYPGPLARGDSTVANQGYDDFGQHITIDSGYDGQSESIGRCSTTQNPLLFWPGGNITFTHTTGAAMGQRYKIVQRLDPASILYKHSYYWDISTAMTLTIAYAKAVWVQYPNTVLNRTATMTPINQGGFVPTTLQDPTACSTMEQIDALFLRQMGENFHQPGTPCPDNPLVFNVISAWPSTRRVQWKVASNPVSHTIRSLVANDLLKTAGGVSSAERGKVMERVLNDWRMSFFGASPKYADFRPLDFDGDGHVQCSCYDINPSATPAEITFRTARWKTAEANGRGPAPTPFTTFEPETGSNPWFSVTGCFYIGKSRFYRIHVRGELYDNLLKKPVCQQTMEAVLAVDPEGPQFPASGRVSSEQRILYQRWMESRSRSELPRQLR